MADMQRTIAALRDENARLKGSSRLPNIKPNAKPSGMEQVTEPKLPEGAAKRRRGSTRDKLVIDEERIIPIDAPPLGSRLKGTTSYVVQDLVRVRPDFNVALTINVYGSAIMIREDASWSRSLRDWTEAGSRSR
jgi:hypothetical protein